MSHSTGFDTCSWCEKRASLYEWSQTGKRSDIVDLCEECHPRNSRFWHWLYCRWTRRSVGEYRQPFDGVIYLDYGAGGLLSPVFMRRTTMTTEQLDAAFQRILDRAIRTVAEGKEREDQ